MGYRLSHHHTTCIYCTGTQEAGYFSRTNRMANAHTHTRTHTCMHTRTHACTHMCVHNTTRPNITVASPMQTIMPVMNRCLHTRSESSWHVQQKAHTLPLPPHTEPLISMCSTYVHTTVGSLPTCCTSAQKCCFRVLLIFLRAFRFLNTEMCETPNTLGSHQFGEYCGTERFPFQMQNWHQFEGEPEMGMTTQHT